MIHSGRKSMTDAPDTGALKGAYAAALLGIAAFILFASVNLSRSGVAPTSKNTTGAVAVMARAEDGTDTKDAYLAPDSVWDYLENIITRLLTGEE